MERKITLKKITLSNWRSINSEVNFNEGLTTISGANGVGKSSIMKAWMWLLTSIPHPNENVNFNLFDCRVPLTPETPKASVKAVIDLNGVEYTLEKRAEAKFTRKRSTNEWEKASSDNYEIYIDEIETTATNFKAWVETNICPMDMLRYCVDGGFFINLINDDKVKARQVLENIIGEIHPEDMKGDYSILLEDMRKFNIPQIEERTKGELKPLRARMIEIPAIIESKQKTLSEYEQIDFETIIQHINSVSKEIEDIDNRILGNGKAIQPILGKRNEILDIINAKLVNLNEVKVAYNISARAKIDAIKRKIDEIKRFNSCVDKDNAERTNKKNFLYNKIQLNEDEIRRLEVRREELIKERDTIKERVFQDDTCSYCGQELPYEMLESAKSKFSERKIKDLEDVVLRGKNNNIEIDRVKSIIESIKEEISLIPAPVTVVGTSELEDELAKANSEFIPFEETSEYTLLSQEIEGLKAILPEIPKEDNETLTSYKKECMGKLNELNRKYGLKVKVDQLKEEIGNLREELKGIGITIARLEGKIDKCKEYTQEKADIISFRVNDRLSETELSMWSIQKDGTLVPDMVLKGKNGVKYGSLNFAHQIRSSIELQQLFMNHYKICLPIFIDEAAVFSSSNVPSIDTQTVFLYASDSPYLIVE